MIFNNVFNDLNPAQCNALLSCLVFQEKSNEMPKLTEDLMQPLRMMQDMARRIAQVTDKTDGKVSPRTQPFLGDFVEHELPHREFLSIFGIPDEQSQI